LFSQILQGQFFRPDLKTVLVFLCFSVIYLWYRDETLNLHYVRFVSGQKLTRIKRVKEKHSLNGLNPGGLPFILRNLSSSDIF
jgi:hypothetical protein